MQFSFIEALQSILASSGFAALADDPRSLIMILVSFVLLYLGIAKKFEPLLLVPIAFGILLANFPLTGMLNAPVDGASPGMLWVFYQGVQHAIYPSIIFLGIGAMTDFGPLIARPSSLLLGARPPARHFHRVPAGAGARLPGRGRRGHRHHRRRGRTDGHSGRLPPGGGLSARYCDRSLFLHGAHPADPAAAHAPADDQEGARGQDGAAAAGLQDREDRVPDRGRSHRHPAHPGHRAADRHAHAGQPAARVRRHRAPVPIRRRTRCATS